MDHSRHINLFQVPLHYRVALIGAGGIGAATALVLAKMGVVQLDVWDADEVSELNLATQLHRVTEVGRLKVYSLGETLEMFSAEIMFCGNHERVDGQTNLSGYNLVISAVDSITARQEIWEAVINSREIDFYVDARMAAQQFQMFLVDLHDMQGVERYHEMLMSLNESDVPDEVCTMKATFFTAMLAAGHIGDALCKILRNEAEPQRLVHYIPQQQILKFNL